MNKNIPGKKTTILLLSTLISLINIPKGWSGAVYCPKPDQIVMSSVQGFQNKQEWIYKGMSTGHVGFIFQTERSIPNNKLLQGAEFSWAGSQRNGTQLICQYRSKTSSLRLITKDAAAAQCHVVRLGLATDSHFDCP